MAKISGPAAAAVGAGALFAYTAIRGKSLTASIQALVQGKSPASLPQANPIADITAPVGAAASSSAGPGSAGVVTGGSVRAILQQTAAEFGWTGAEWTALDHVENAEAGYNSRAKNPSGAYGIAQSLGHPYPGGPAPDGVNEYGGFGLTAAQSEQASMGQAGPQALWMCGYIKATYGTPSAAWAHEQAAHWY